MDNVTLYQYVKANYDPNNNAKIHFLGNAIGSKVVLDKIEQFAYFLSLKNLKKDEIVTMSLPNMPEAIYTLYGANKIGVTVALINPLLKENSFLNKLSEFKSKLVILLDSQYILVKDKLKERNIKAVVCKVSDSSKGIYKLIIKAKEKKFTLNEGDILFSQINESGNTIESNDYNKTAVLIHGSGTTGSPKATMLTNYAINKVTDQLIDEVISSDYNCKESLLAVLPIFHAFGLTVCFQASLFKGKILLFPRFDKKLIVNAIKKYKVNYLPSVPTLLKKLMTVRSFDGKHLRHMRFIFCGGDKLNIQVKNKFNALLEKHNSPARIQEGYGLTEIGGVFCVNPLDAIKEDSVGITFKENNVMVVDNNYNSVKNGEYGEILIYSPAMMAGYYDQTISSKSIFVELDGKKWLRTGDIGYLDDQKYIYFVDRLKRSIKIGSTNVFPSEVEQYVNKLDFIDNSCVVRIKHEIESFTKILVETKEGQPLTNRHKEAINKIILDNINKYSIPKEILQVKRLNLTPMGKIDFSYYEKVMNEEK